MERIIIIKNILDDFGRTLIAKDVEVVLDACTIEKLERLGVLQQVLEQKKKDVEDSEDVEDRVEEFRDKYGLDNTEQLNTISQILQEIIFNNRHLDWYIHLKALINYNKWIYTHAIDVALLSGMVGTTCKYSDQKLKDLVLGALLHDIGMLLVPEEIGYKENRTMEEEAIVRKHGKLGISTVCDIGLSEESKSIILQHHERLDGSGYPNGIKKDEISELAQLVMVVDKFDRETAYKEGGRVRSQEEVLHELLMNEDKYSKKYATALTELLG